MLPIYITVLIKLVKDFLYFVFILGAKKLQERENETTGQWAGIAEVK